MFLIIACVLRMRSAAWRQMLERNSTAFVPCRAGNASKRLRAKNRTASTTGSTNLTPTPSIDKRMQLPLPGDNAPISPERTLMSLTANAPGVPATGHPQHHASLISGSTPPGTGEIVSSRSNVSMHSDWDAFEAGAMLHQDQATGKMHFTHHYMRAASKSATGGSSKPHTGNLLAPAHRGPSRGSSIEPHAWRSGSVDLYPKVVAAPSVASTGGAVDRDGAGPPAIFRPRQDATLDQLLLEGTMQEGAALVGGASAEASRQTTGEWRWSQPQEAAVDAAVASASHPGDARRRAERQMAAALLLKGEEEEPVSPADGLSPAAAVTTDDGADDDGDVDRESERALPCDPVCGSIAVVVWLQEDRGAPDGCGAAPEG